MVENLNSRFEMRGQGQRYKSLTRALGFFSIYIAAASMSFPRYSMQDWLRSGTSERPGLAVRTPLELEGGSCKGKEKSRELSSSRLGSQHALVAS